MAVIRSFQDAIGVLTENPVVLVGGVLMTLLLAPQTFLQQIGIPLLPTLIGVVTFFVAVFIYGGLFAMAYEGLHRKTSMDTFKKMGKDRYVSLLGGYLVNFGISFAFGLLGIVLFIATVGFALISALSAIGTGGGSDLSTALTGGGAIVALVAGAVLLLVYLIIWFFLQFYGVAIVVDKEGVVDGYKKSYALVRQNILATLAYSVIKLLIALVLAVPFLVIVVAPIALPAAGVASGDLTSFTSTMVAGLVAFGYLTLLRIVMVPFSSAFAVAFYDHHAPS